MSDVIRSQLRELQRQVEEAARAVERLSPEGSRGRRRLKEVGRRTSELSREASDYASRHPAATGLLVLGVIAIAAAWLMHSDRD